MVFAVNAIKILLYPWYPRSLEVKTIYYKNSQIKNENKLKNPFKFVKRIPKIKFLKKKTENVDNFVKKLFLKTEKRSTSLLLWIKMQFIHK